MGKMLGRYIILGWALFFLFDLFPSLAKASDTIKLLSGRTVTGNIVKRDPLKLMIYIKGIPETYYIGEIATINGINPEKRIFPLPPEIPAVSTMPKAPAPVPMASALAAKPAPYFNDEQDALERFMVIKNQNNGNPIPEPISSDKMKVVPTSDGGFVVIGTGKIIKYDKDLNYVKAVNLAS